MEDKEITLVWDDGVQGFSTFKRAVPDFGLSLNNRYLTGKVGGLWEDHRNDVPRNQFYGRYSPTEITVVFNDAPDVVKNAKAISYEGDQDWFVEFSSEAESEITDRSTIPATRSITGSVKNFKEKEGKYFGVLKNNEKNVNNIDIKSASVTGVGTGSYTDMQTDLDVRRNVMGGFVDGRRTYQSYIREEGDMISFTFLYHADVTINPFDQISIRFYRVFFDGTDFLRSRTIVRPLVLEGLRVTSVGNDMTLGGNAATVMMSRGQFSALRGGILEDSIFLDTITDETNDPITDDTSDIITSPDATNYFFLGLQTEIFKSPVDPRSTVTLNARPEPGAVGNGDKLYFYRQGDRSIRRQINFLGTIDRVLGNDLSLIAESPTQSNETNPNVNAIPSTGDFFLIAKNAAVDSAGSIGTFHIVKFVSVPAETEGLTNEEIERLRLNPHELFSTTLEYFVSSS